MKQIKESLIIDDFYRIVVFINNHYKIGEKLKKEAIANAVNKKIIYPITNISDLDREIDRKINFEINN